MSIDSELDAIRQQYAEIPENVIGETALKVAGLLHPIFELVNILRKQLSTKARWERVKALLDGGWCCVRPPTQS